MLRRAVTLGTNLARNLAVDTSRNSAITASSFHNSARTYSFFKNPFKEQKIQRFGEFISSSENHTSVPYEFRNPRKSLLLEALSKPNAIIDNSKLNYIAANVDSTDIDSLSFTDQTKLKLAIFKEDRSLIKRYMNSTSISEKIAVLDFFIGYYQFSLHYNYYYEFIHMLESNTSCIKKAVVLDLLNNLLKNAENLPELDNPNLYKHLKSLLCAGVYSDHIKNLSQSTLTHLFEFAICNNKSGVANKLASIIDLANLKNPTLILKVCLKNNLDDLALKIAQTSHLDPLTSLVAFAVNWENFGMMQHILRVFNPMRDKVDAALENIIVNSSSQYEVKFAKQFLSESHTLKTYHNNTKTSKNETRKTSVKQEAKTYVNQEPVTRSQNTDDGFPSILNNILITQHILDSTRKHSETAMPKENEAAEVEVPHSVTHDTFRGTGGMSRSRSDDHDYSRSYDTRNDDYSSSASDSGSSGSSD